MTRDVGAQVPLEAFRIDLPRLAQRPADGFVNQVVFVGMQTFRDLVHEIDRMASPHRMQQPTIDARRTHMLRCFDHARISGMSSGYRASSGPISMPQIVSVVAQLAA